MNLDFNNHNLPRYWQVKAVYTNHRNFSRFRDSVLAYLNSLTGSMYEYRGIPGSANGAYYGVFSDDIDRIIWGPPSNHAVTLTLEEFIEAFETKKSKKEMKEVKYHKDTPNILPKNWVVALNKPGMNHSVVNYLNSFSSRPLYLGISRDFYGRNKGKSICTSSTTTMSGCKRITIEEFKACFQPKTEFERGEKVIVKGVERIYLTYIEGDKLPHRVVQRASEKAFLANKPFSSTGISKENVKKLPKKDEIKVTVEINGESAALSDLKPEQLEALLNQED